MSPSFEVSRMKYFLYYFLPLTVLFLLLGIGTVYQQKKTFYAEIELKQASVIKNEKQLIEAALASYMSDVTTLADISRTELTQDLPSSQAYEMLTQFFYIFSKHHALYDQIRFINTSGIEKIRINHTNDNKILITPATKLQNKKDRPYVKKAMAGNCAIYVSRFDLNVENNEIEQPFKPVIRITYPVENKNGEKAGIIVLNVRGEAILNQLQTAGSNSKENFFLINDKGYWLKGPNPESDWLFMFDKPIKTSMPLLYPNVWQHMMTIPNDQLKSDEGLFTYTTIELKSTSDLFGMTTGKILKDEEWILVSIVPNDFLYPNWWNAIKMITAVLSALIIILSWILADYRIRRIKAAHKLENNERKLSSITETVLDAIIMIDASGRAVFWNKAAETMFGFSYEEVRGKNIHDFIASKEDQQASTEGLKNFAKIGAGPIIGVKREVEARKKNGDNFPAELNINAVKIDDQWWAVGVVRDITDWKKNQSKILTLNEDLEERVTARTMDLEVAIQNLDQKEKLSKLLIKVTSIANTAKSLEEAFKAALLFVTRYIGWPLGHVYQVSDNEKLLTPTGIWQVESPEKFKDFIEVTSRVTFLPGQGVPGFVYSTRQPQWIVNDLKDKGYIRLSMLKNEQIRSCFSFPVFVGDRVSAVLEFYSDKVLPLDPSIIEMARQVGYHLGHVVERKKADMELKEFKTTLDQTKDAVFIFDPETLLFTYVNQGAMKQLGYSEEEMLQISPIDIKPEFTEESFKEIISTLITGSEKSIFFETVHEHKDGHHIPVDILLQYVVRPNEPSRFVAIVRDISEQKRINAELELAKDEAEAATRAKSSFLANMSHEIRTPMNAIIGMSHVVLKSELTNKQQGQLKKILGAATSLLGLINDILDFSKIEANRLELEKQPFNLDDILHSLSTVVQSKAEDNGIELIFDVGLDVPRMLIGDSLRLGQVLTNLTTNAIKFTEKGHVIVKVERISEFEETSLFKFSVTDTGIGIPEQKKNILFEAFSQIDTSTTRKYGGTGLGLSISARLVNMMGGEIKIDSTPGIGSTFHFSIKLKCQKQDCHMYEPLEELRGTRVLIIDNSESYWPIYTQMFARYAFESVFAQSKEQGEEMLLDAIASKPFDLLLMSLDLHDLDGFAFRKELLENEALQGLKILTITAFPKRFELNDEQTTPDLIKPISQSSLFDIVLQVLGKEVIYQDTGAISFSRAKDRIKSLMGAKILVAEDNDLNQEVARELLEDVGADITIVNNGALAVDAVLETKFDAVLMDVQMPIMGGLEATERIRKTIDSEMLPIIAMTAHAMTGDSEKSLAAGMNAHITKPVDPTILYTTLIRWITGDEKVTEDQIELPDYEKDKMNDIDNYAGLNVRQGLARVAGKKESYFRLLKQFITNHKNALDQIAEAIYRNDIEDARQKTHSLKGVAGNIGAMELHKMLETLEIAFKEKDLIKSSELLDTGRKVMNQTLTAIDAFLVGNVSSAPVVEERLKLTQNETLTKLEELAELLADSDANALSWLETFARSVPPEISSDISKISTQVQQFDFEAALNTVQTTIKTLENSKKV